MTNTRPAMTNALIWPYYIGRYIAKTFVQL